METKKSPLFDIEKKRSGLLQIGLLFSIGLVLAAFEYTAFDQPSQTLTALPEEIGVPEPPPIIPPKPKPEKEQPEEKQEKKKLSTEQKSFTDKFKKADDDKKIKDGPPVTDSFVSIGPIVEYDTVAPEDTDGPFPVVEEYPYFPKYKKLKNPAERRKRSEEDLPAIIGKDIRYTQKMIDMNVKGTVKVAFVLGTDGKVESAKVTRGLHEDLDSQVLKAAYELPEMIPGMQRGKPVKVPYVIAIKFELK